MSAIEDKFEPLKASNQSTSEIFEGVATPRDIAMPSPTIKPDEGNR
jgi:hypothetical protein